MSVPNPGVSTPPPLVHIRLKPFSFASGENGDFPPAPQGSPWGSARTGVAAWIPVPALTSSGWRIGESEPKSHRHAVTVLQDRAGHRAQAESPPGRHFWAGRSSWCHDTGYTRPQAITLDRHCAPQTSAAPNGRHLPLLSRSPSSPHPFHPLSCAAQHTGPFPLQKPQHL